MKLMLHSCCGVCSSAVIKKLYDEFENLDLTVLFYNPNIQPKEEWERRLEAQKVVISFYQKEHSNIKLLVCESFDEFDEMVLKNHLNFEPEGGKRCPTCFAMRLQKTAEIAKNMGGFDAFCTTLTVSPHKPANLINEIGESIAQKIGIPFLKRDFKKQNGFLLSSQISKQLGIYRQNYCGCLYVQKNKEIV